MNNVNANTFVSTLPEEVQNEICKKVKSYLKKNGYKAQEVEETIENVLCDRLWNIDEILDISVYFS